MPDSPSPETLSAELEILLARNGIKVPDKRRDTVMEAYADLRRQVALLHGRYGAADEPSNVFRLSPTQSQGGAT